MMHQEPSPCEVTPFPLPIPAFPDQDAYRSYCHGLVARFRASDKRFPEPQTFDAHLGAIEQGGDMVIKTGWGGVDILTYNHPSVEKWLVVKEGFFLAFEKHAEKVETLIGEEGLGVLVYRPHNQSSLAAEFITPGWTKTLQPGQEHTIIALSNLLVREKSLDFKGMDKDLIFIFMPTDS